MVHLLPFSIISFLYIKGMKSACLKRKEDDKKILSGLPPLPSPLASLTSSFICKGTFYAYMYVYEVGGGTRGEEERVVGGGGEMAKLKADAERLFFLDPGGICWQWVSGT